MQKEPGRGGERRTRRGLSSPAARGAQGAHAEHRGKVEKEEKSKVQTQL